MDEKLANFFLAPGRVTWMRNYPINSLAEDNSKVDNSKALCYFVHCARHSELLTPIYIYYSP